MSEGNNNLYKFQEWLEGKIAAVLPEEVEILCRRKGNIDNDGSMTVHYWLVRSANIPRDADALPTSDAFLENAKKSITTYLKKGK